MTNIREIKCVSRDKHGAITGIGGDWGYVDKAKAIQQIKNREYSYFVTDERGDNVQVIVKNRNELRSRLLNLPQPTNWYLTTTPDDTQRNNLDDLPTCQ